jgi:hypothetical protein
MMAAKFPAQLPGAIVHQRRAVRLDKGEPIGCFSVHRVLEASDVGSHVLDAASIAVSRRSRRVKTDWIDVETLLRWRAREAANLFMVRPPRQALHFRCCRNAETVVSLRKMDCPRGPLTWPVAEAGSPLRWQLAPSYVCPVIDRRLRLVPNSCQP